MGSSESEFETDSGTRWIRDWMAAREDAELWMQLHESVAVPEFPRVGHWWHDQVNLDHYHRRPNDQASIRSDSSSHSSMPELVHSSDSADSADSADSDVEADADDAGAAPSTGLATTAHVVPLLLHMQVAGGLGEDSRAAVGAETIGSGAMSPMNS